MESNSHECAGAADEELLGTPSMFPHDTEAVWDISDHAHLYIVEEPERAGSSVAFLMLGNLRDHLDGCAIEPAVDEIYDNGVRKVTFRDFDGNELAFGTMP